MTPTPLPASNPPAAPIPADLAADLQYLPDLGFVLVDGDRPGHGAGPRLLIAMRDLPTYVHFDPEWILAWTARDGRGRRVRIDRSALHPIERFSWGSIRVFDRLGVYNTFVTFGGTVLAAEIARDLAVVRFASPAPILRWAGHSQPLDSRAADVESFFARLMIPIDFEPGAEALVSATEPVALYAAMIADFAARIDHPLWRGLDKGTDRWARGERHRLRTEEPDAWTAGQQLLAHLHLVGPARPVAVSRPERTPGAGHAGSDW